MHFRLLPTTQQNFGSSLRSGQCCHFLSAGEQPCDISEKFCKHSLLPPEQFFSWEGCLVVDLTLNLPSSFPQTPTIKKYILFHFQMTSLFSKTNKNKTIQNSIAFFLPQGEIIGYIFATWCVGIR